MILNYVASILKFTKQDNIYELDGEILFKEIRSYYRNFKIWIKWSYIFFGKSGNKIKLYDIEFYENIFSNACTTYKITLTIPVTAASAKRNFSELKFIKIFFVIYRVSR